MSTEPYVIRESLRRRGGEWLGKARAWMQSNIRFGDTLAWSSADYVKLPFNKLEELALEAAVGAMMEANRVNEGPGAPAFRFNRFLDELEKRYPHPKPFDSTKTYEQYFLEWLDERLKADDANLTRGWVQWNGEGAHPTGDTKVFYRMRDGDTCDDAPSRSADLDWSHTPMKQDWEIVAYKVAE